MPWILSRDWTILQVGNSVYPTDAMRRGVLLQILQDYLSGFDEADTDREFKLENCGQSSI
jgi:hypothetical protein